MRAQQTTGGGLKTRNTLFLCTYNLANAVYINFRQAVHTNSGTDQTPISTAIYPQQENKQIWTTNPRHKQDLQNTRRRRRRRRGRRRKKRREEEENEKNEDEEEEKEEEEKKEE